MDILKKLQSPELVADFQQYFGVQRLKNDVISTKSSNIKDLSSSNETKSNQTDVKQRSKGNIWDDILFKGGTVGGMEGCGKDSSSTHPPQPEYIIKNWFWYYLFMAATKTGDEIFYAVFFPFWAWNVDGAVLRRVMVIWMVTMYIGQALKDVLKVPRPKCPPVVRLDTKWVLEYGLPSTHAMVAMSIPFSILILSLQRYQLDALVCTVVATVWCSLICLSRIYLGMHSVLDIICGLGLNSILLSVFLPFIDVIDHLTLSHPAAPLIILTLTLAMVVCYPSSDRWTPARGDTTVIVGVGCGCLIGSWINYQTGVIREASLIPPYSIMWPTLPMVGLTILRTVLGVLSIGLIRAAVKGLSMNGICALLQIKPSDYRSHSSKVSTASRTIIEQFYKFVTYVAIGIDISYLSPLVFRHLGIDRPTFYTEV